MDEGHEDKTFETKVIYFDSNDVMYTEEEVNRNKRLAEKRRNNQQSNEESLTRLVVRIPEHERQRLKENESKKTKHRLEEFLKQINEKKSTHAKATSKKRRTHSAYTGGR